MGGLIQKWRDWRDEKQLAEHQARDAQLGTPTQATLNERAQKAAESGRWKTAIAAIDQGADVNMSVTRSWSSRDISMEGKLPLVHVAIEQDNADALAQLLKHGARLDVIATTTYTGTWGSERKHSPLEFAAFQGAKKCMAVLLEHGGNPQEALDGALKIAAGEKSYLGMVEGLLAAGARGFEEAQRAAEVRRNDSAIILIKGAAKKAFAAAQDKPETPASSPEAVKPSRPLRL